MTSIYQAEIRYHYRQCENKLTSRVFGALAMLPPETVLLPFLKKLASDQNTGEVDNEPALAAMKQLKSQDITSVKQPIALWKTMGNSYPDVCINTRKVLIVIEVKKDTKPAPEQFVRELVGQYRGASQKAKNKKLAYFLLTKGYEEPDEIKKAQDELKCDDRNARILWRRWPQVYGWLRDISNSDKVDCTVKNLLNATIKLLEVENMKGPTGFKAEWFNKEASEALDMVQELYREVSITMEDVKRELKDKKIKSLADDPNLKNRRQLDSLNELVHRNPTFYFMDEKWTEVKDEDTNPSIFVSFGLEDGNLGPSVGLYWNHRLEENMIDEIKEQADLKGLYPEYQDEELHVYNNLEIGELEKGEQAVKTLVDKLVEIRDFTNGLETLREALGN